MEQINNQGQPIPNQPVSQSPAKSAPLKDKTFLIFAMVIGIILLILTAIILVISLSKPKPDTLPTSLIQPTVIPTAIPTISETADWKTYKNDQYGYQFIYPSSWTLEEMSKQGLGGVDILYSYSPPKTQQLDPNFWKGKVKVDIGKMLENKKPEQTLEEWVSEREVSEEMFTKISQEKTLIDGQPAIKETYKSRGKGQEVTNIVYTIENRNEIYFINIYTGLESDLETTLYNQILSTFKFLP